MSEGLNGEGLNGEGSISEGLNGGVVKKTEQALRGSVEPVVSSPFLKFASLFDMNESQCPTVETIQYCLNGMLSEEKSEDLEQHFEHCQRCRETVQVVEGELASQDSLLNCLGNVGRDHPESDSGELEEPVRQAIKATLQREGLAGETDKQGLGQEAIEVSNIVGDYEILSTLGRGGMGVVFLARHRKLGRRVALKVLSRRRWQDDSAIARFTREMTIVGRMSHSAMISATDAGKADGVHYLVMEWVDGLDLRRINNRLGPLADAHLADACELIRQAALGMQYAHEQGVVHRDVKPSNLMLDRMGKVKVLDLGLAKLTGLDGAADQLTTIGQLLGTLDYMAPEQCEAIESSSGVACDIYSLGATLYRLLSDTPPYGDSQLSPILRLRQMANSEPVGILERLPGLPPGLAEVIDRCLSRNPSDRFASAAELATALQEYCVDHDLPALLDLAIERGPVDSDLPTVEEVDREFENAASEIRQFRKERYQRRQARWAVAVVAAIIVLGGVAFLMRNFWLQDLGGRQEVAQPSKPAAVSPDRVQSEPPPLPKPDEAAASMERASSAPESEEGEVVQELESALVVVAPFASVRLKLTRDDQVVKEWAMESPTETIRLPKGRYRLRQLSHLDRLKLDRTGVEIQHEATQLVSLERLVDARSNREVSELIDIEGVPKKDLDKFIESLSSSLKASVTEDDRTLVVKGRAREIADYLGFWQDGIAARSTNGLAIGSNAPPSQWFFSDDNFFKFSKSAADSDVADPYQLTLVERAKGQPRSQLQGQLRVRSIGLPGKLNSVVTKGRWLLVMSELPISQLKKGKSQLLVSLSSLYGKTRTINFDFEPCRIFTSNVDNDWFYRVVEEYRHPAKLQKYSLTTGEMLQEVVLFPKEREEFARQSLVGISADGTRLLVARGTKTFFECDFNEDAMTVSPLRSIRLPLNVEKKNLFSYEFSTDSVREVWSAWDPAKEPLLSSTLRAVHPNRRLIARKHRSERVVVIENHLGEEVHRIPGPPEYLLSSLGWTSKGKELAICFGNRTRLIDVSAVVEPYPLTLSAKMLPQKLKAEVARNWKLPLQVYLKGNREQSIDGMQTQIVKGPDGLSINDLDLSWTPSAEQVGTHSVVINLTGKILGAAKDSPTQLAEGQLEIEVAVEHRSFGVPQNLTPSRLSDEGQYVLMTKRGRIHPESRIVDEAIVEMAVIDTRDGGTLVADEFQHVVAETAFVNDYLFVFFANHPEAIRYDLNSGMKKVFQLDLGADLNRTRKTTGLPFSERLAPNNPPPSKHLTVNAVTESEGQLLLHYNHGYWLSKWDNVLAVRDVLDIESLTVDLKQRKIAPFVQVTIASCPGGTSHFANRLFEQRTGKLIHNVACRWLPVLSLDAAKIKAVDDYVGPFAIPVLTSDERWREKRMRMQARPKIVSADGGKDIIWRETSVRLSRNEGVADRFGAVVGLGATVVCDKNSDRLVVIDWPGPEEKNKSRRLSEAACALFDFSRNEVVFSADQSIRLYPALRPEVYGGDDKGLEIELLGDDRFLKWDGKQIVFDVVAARKQYVADCQEKNMQLTNKKFLFRNTLEKSTDYIFVFDDQVLFKELAGKELPKDAVAFQYPIRYRVKISGTGSGSSVEEVVHQNIILLVPRSDFKELAKHRSMSEQEGE